VVFFEIAFLLKFGLLDRAHIKSKRVIFYTCIFIEFKISINWELGLFLGSYFVNYKELMCLLLILTYVLKVKKRISVQALFII
jgi:hypothetical protein